MAIEDLDRRFGAIAVKKGFITSEQLIDALTTQVVENVTSGGHTIIGAILREKGYLTIDQIDQVLKDMM